MRGIQGATPMLSYLYDYTQADEGDRISASGENIVVWRVYVVPVPSAPIAVRSPASQARRSHVSECTHVYRGNITAVSLKAVPIHNLFVSLSTNENNDVSDW